MDFDRDFGVNQVFVEDQYQRWLQNPAAVSTEWAQYFGRLHGSTVFQTSAWSQPAPAAVAASREQLQESVDELINAYRIRGHLFARLDPLGLLQPPPTAELELATFGLAEGDLDKSFPAFGTELPLRDIIDRLQRTYCRTIGVEYMHGEDPAIKQWLQQKMESTGNMAALSREQKLRILARLTDAETIETFLHRKYIGKKRFSLEGGESLIPLLDWLIEEFDKLGGEEIVLGMAHRGRLNVLVNVLGKGLHELFAEFEDSESEIEKMLGRGDVKYHLGYSSNRGKMHLSLAFNPSHLEIVNPVVEGRVRAKQDRTLNWEGAPNPRDPDRRKVLPVLIHGDAAFAGQGIVAEVLNLANLEGYATGGTVHVIINNQVGFTTNPEDARSTPYCTDIARVLRAPVFHVNGEDPEAVVWAVQLAVEYRQMFQQDVLIDLYCYRKYGHNEGDEPAFTQPRMYEVIRNKQPPREVYARRLAEEGVASDGEADALMKQRVERLESELERTRKEGAKRTGISAMAGLWNKYRGGPDAETPDVPTQVPEPKLRELLVKLSEVPAGFTPNDKVARLLEQRRRIAGGNEAFDWGVGEHLAFATLLDEGAPIRFSGQDARRGTFSHRHAVLADARDGKRYMPLAHLREGQGRIDIFDSPLSEAGVMGFDYGWSLDMPEALCCWEAQFGDFANGAQVVIDQFISSAEDKWNRLCGMVLLLPHGFEGQGPEHSSARLERYLQLCAEDNMQVCYPTTPAQIFHVLRRQVLRPWRKPLVVLTPKSLLRHKHAVSSLEDLSRGAFRRIIWDHDVPRGARRVLLCTGKVYYDLLAGREEKKRNDVALIRIEQLYPLSDELLAEALKPHAGAEVVWVQEEPFNMGAWYYLRARWPSELGKLSCVSRPESASPATGSEKSHKFEQHLLVDQAFGDAPMRRY